jgi:hypothetical protein
METLLCNVVQRVRDHAAKVDGEQPLNKKADPDFPRSASIGFLPTQLGARLPRQAEADPLRDRAELRLGKPREGCPQAAQSRPDVTGAPPC